MKIAVIGSGISGLSAAWLLAPHHEVVLFEKDHRLGGHANTIDVTDSDGRTISVDTGFVAFSPDQYPNLVKLFGHFNVPSAPTSMKISVSIDGGAFEYSNNVPDGIFADRENVLRISFYEFLLEIERFNKAAHDSLKEGISPHETLGEWLAARNFTDDFREKYLFALIGAIWSTPKKLALGFPCAELMTFLDRHHLLSVSKLPQWRTVSGGSREYVERVVAEIRSYGGIIRSGMKVRTVRRSGDFVEVVTSSKVERFDYVVFSSHADETLRLLDRPTREERALLSAFTYEKNEVYVHSDLSLMPRRREAWASWNYIGQSGWGSKTKKVCLTYDMNRLQGLNAVRPVLVTLNPVTKPKASLTWRKISYTHPVCTCITAEIRGHLNSLQNKNRSLFCGSYFGYGFHEDGITSAINAVRHLGVRPPWSHEN